MRIRTYTSGMYHKDYEKWHRVKRKLDERKGLVFAHAREIWWCSLGVNVGSEIDGKNENFERPVLVLRVYNRDTMLVVPLTTKHKTDMFHLQITADKKTVYAALTQLRVVSSRRLLRKIDVLQSESFNLLKATIQHFI